MLANPEQLSWATWQMPSMDQPSTQHDAGITTLKPATSAPLSSEQEAQLQAQFEEARSEGWQVGLNEGREAARQEMHMQTQRWDSLMDQLMNPYQHIDEAVKQSLLGLALQIGQRLAMRELSISPDALMACIEQAVSLLPKQGQVQVQMNPEDARFVKAQLGDTPIKWQIEEQPGMHRGGVTVINEISKIDASFESRLDALMAQLTRQESA